MSNVTVLTENVATVVDLIDRGGGFFIDVRGELRRVVRTEVREGSVRFVTMLGVTDWYSINDTISVWS